ncbi:Putative membrane-bound redox modulator Alx [Anaerolineae bacterium]|nr:Putative membrane-bound redox modulator Alx [Anaerolineae bacterium]
MTGSELMSRELLMFAGFTVVVGIMLYVDLFLVNRKAHVITIKSALTWSAIWIGASLLFNVFVYYELGSEKALMYLAAYLIEKSLSVDNLFVFLVVFSYFGIAPLYQPRILRWGILGAIVMRALLIVVGVELVHTFSWMLYVFGAILIVTAFRLFNGVEDDVNPGNNAALKFVSRYLPVTHELHAEKFIVRLSGVLYATPLLATLVVIESTDLLFALDSIPAVLGISNDLFIVYTSNIFAILGLRALYFALAGVMQLFHYLKSALAIILGFIGVKMLLHEVFKIPTEIALGVVFVLLALAIVASLLFPKKDAEEIKAESALAGVSGEAEK